MSGHKLFSSLHNTPYIFKFGSFIFSKDDHESNTTAFCVQAAKGFSASAVFVLVSPILTADSLFLDGNYAAFGHVTEGIEIVDQICKDTPVQDDNGKSIAGERNTSL